MKLSWIGCLFFLSTPAIAQPPNPPPLAAPRDPSIDPFSSALIQQVQARQRLAVEGDADEAKKLTSDLEKWTHEQPGNYLLEAYLGSTYTIDSRNAWPGPGKLTFLREGAELLDTAVSADPLNPAVRFVRAIDYLELPAIFGKRQVARDDFQFLLKQISGEVKTPYALSTKTVQAIYYYAGKSVRQQGNVPTAKNLWTRGLALDPSSALAIQIQSELARAR